MKDKFFCRLVSIVLVLSMALGGMIIASASEEYTSGEYTYTIESGKATIVTCPETTKGLVNIPSTLGAYYVSGIGDNSFYACTLITDVMIPDSVVSIGNNAFAYCTSLKTISIPAKVTQIGDSAFKHCTSLKDVYYSGTESEWNAIKIGDVNECLTGATIHFGNIKPSENPKENIYNLGEETYSFKNFEDGDSSGHCFGMSVTSAGYYNGMLDISTVGIDNAQKINTLTRTEAVKAPICRYQYIQGSYSKGAIVAGGSRYITDTSNISSDWNEVINYVKNHNYDNKGSLQIGFRKDGIGGHAVNFLYYSEVNGQQRIYAYDNNFPNIETYFYKGSDGKVYQAPYSTFNGSAIDCIALRDIAKYFTLASGYNAAEYVYAEANTISIKNATVFAMECGVESNEWVMFELPRNVDSVTITPLIDNATFIYLDQEYSFEKIDENTAGVLNLATGSDGSYSGARLTIVDKSQISINPPSTTTISYGDSIILHVDVLEGILPEGGRVEWSADNENFKMSVSSDGTTCEITPSSSGDTTFTATVYDKDGNVVSSDTQKMTSKAGLWQKIIAFFKKLFSLNKVIPEVFKGIIK